MSGYSLFSSYSGSQYGFKILARLIAPELMKGMKRESSFWTELAKFLGRMKGAIFGNTCIIMRQSMRGIGRLCASELAFFFIIGIAEAFFKTVPSNYRRFTILDERLSLLMQRRAFKLQELQKKKMSENWRRFTGT